jgi:hypothetical protein
MALTLTSAPPLLHHLSPASTLPSSALFVLHQKVFLLLSPPLKTALFGSLTVVNSPATTGTLSTPQLSALTSMRSTRFAESGLRSLLLELNQMLDYISTTSPVVAM